MAEKKPDISHSTIVEWVHEALGHLYDSHDLQDCPLAKFLAGEIADPLPRSQEVRRVLLEAIRSIRPEAGVPVQSSDWRSYRIMELRYIKGLNPVEAMNQLALSKSQFFREQARAVEQVAQALQENPAFERHSPEGSPSRETLAHSEADRLVQGANWEPVDVGRLMEDLRSVVEPLARIKRTEIRYSDLEGLWVPRADRIILRQAILNILTYALDMAVDGRLTVQGIHSGEEKRLSIRAESAGGETNARQGVGLEVCRRLIREMGGELIVDDRRAGEWSTRLVWGASRSRTLLVIDDNQEFADLFRRFLTMHHWEVIGAADGESAYAEISRKRPAVILLDVMMPRQDGWEFLMGFKAREDTRDIPVIICSVLSEPQLAASLGADAYLTKPVTQQALLQALAPWDREESGPEPKYEESPARSEATPT
jgi:CheY-like chemotaxis protein